MTEVLSNFIEKISSYQLFNYLFPGAIFIYGTEHVTSFSFGTDDFVYRFFILYAAGMIMSRVGSVIIERMYKCLCIVVYAEYPNFLKASKEDDKLNVLVMENNTYRTLVATFFSMLLCWGLDQSQCFSLFNASRWSTPLYLVLLGLLFSIAFRKQITFIRKRTHRLLAIDDEKEIKELKNKQKCKIIKKIQCFRIFRK